MYHGKYEKPIQPRRLRKPAILLVSLLLMCIIAAGGTLAYICASTGLLTNRFVPSHVSCEVVEDPFLQGTSTEKTNVKIHNTGNVEAYIRVALIVTWKDGEDGSVYGKRPVRDRDYSIELNTENGWTLGTDGFYYYTVPVAPDDSDETTDSDMTGVLIQECTYLANAPEGYTLNVEIIASAIQSQPPEVVTAQWASGVSGVNGTTLVIKEG